MFRRTKGVSYLYMIHNRGQNFSHDLATTKWLWYKIIFMHWFMRGVASQVFYYLWMDYILPRNLRAAAAYQKAYSKTLCGRQLSSECFTLPSLMASKTAHYGGELIPFLEREEMVGLRMVFTPGSHSFLFFFSSTTVSLNFSTSS